MIDRGKNEGGIMFFVREDIPCKLLSLENQLMEGFYVELIYQKPNSCFLAPLTQIETILIFT